MFVGARIFYTLWSLAVLALFPSVLQNLDLFGVPVVASFEMATGKRYVYSRVVADRVLRFERVDAQRIRDVETGSEWDLQSGRALNGAYAGQILRAAPYTAEDIFPYHSVQAEGGWFGVWHRFDVLWYQALAERGYAGTPNGIHFAPLYPALMSALGGLLGARTFLAGWLIAQAALIAALAYLYRIAERWQGTQVARRAVIFTVLFPTAFFFMTAYSEALFLLLSVLCFEAIHRRAWVWAGVWTSLTVLTRLQGIALIVPLAYIVWQEWKGLDGMRRVDLKKFLALVAMLALPFAAGGVYLLLRALVGEGTIVPTQEPQLNARLALPWENLVYAVQTLWTGRFLAADVLNFAVTLLALAILIQGWRVLPPAYGLYAAATLLIAMSRYVDTQPLNSMTRYVLTLFPLTLLLAYWSQNRWVERAYVYVCLPLSLYLSAQFLLWGWVA